MDFTQIPILSILTFLPLKITKQILVLSIFILFLPLQVNAQVVGNDCNRTSVGFKPLIDMGADEYYPNASHVYREEGGLYGYGSNSIPSAHYQKAVTATSQIKPLNANGQVDEANGKIGIVSLGMSNTTQVFSKFKEIADAGGSGKSSKVVLVTKLIIPKQQDAGQLIGILLNSIPGRI